MDPNGRKQTRNRPRTCQDQGSPDFRDVEHEEGSGRQPPRHKKASFAAEMQPEIYQTSTTKGSDLSQYRFQSFAEVEPDTHLPAPVESVRRNPSERVQRAGARLQRARRQRKGSHRGGALSRGQPPTDARLQLAKRGERSEAPPRRLDQGRTPGSEPVRGDRRWAAAAAAARSGNDGTTAAPSSRRAATIPTDGLLLPPGDRGQRRGVESNPYSNVPGAFHVVGESMNYQVPAARCHCQEPMRGAQPQPGDQQPLDPTRDLGATTFEAKKPSRKLFHRIIAFVIVLLAPACVAVFITLRKSSSSESTMSRTEPPSSPPTAEPEWHLLGQRVSGLREGENFGRTLAISFDGSIFAASTANSDGPDNVRVYRLSNEEEWVQLGVSFQTTDHAFVDLARNGSIVSIATVGIENNSTVGTVNLYEWRGSSWSQIGQTIVAPESSSRYFGYETKVSEDGSVIVVDDPGVGVTTLYSWNGSNWTQVGQQLVRDPILETFKLYPTGDFLRSSVSINRMGNVVAVGGKDSDQGRFVRVYELNQANKWTQRGADLEATLKNHDSGFSDYFLSVSLSSDGTAIAIGSRDHSRIWVASGNFKVLRFDGEEWLPVGEAVDGDQSGGYMGTSISMSADGTTCAVGVPFRLPRMGLVAFGKTYVYRELLGEWVQLGETVEAVESNILVGNTFGAYVALSSDSRTVAISDQTSTENNVSAGSVSVFRLH